MKNQLENKIINSWHKNVEPWIKAVRDNEIESRVLVTNKAITDLLLFLSPQNILDVGCGEGWLVRAMHQRGIDAYGIDAIPGLIKAAKTRGEGQFEVMTYEELSYNRIKKRFDVVVCNFSLFGEHSVSRFFQQVSSIINPGGYLVIQTLHPEVGEAKHFEEGWQKGSWVGFNDQFQDPAPWYFRPIPSWIALYESNGFSSPTINAPIHPNTEEPASIIFYGKRI